MTNALLTPALQTAIVDPIAERASFFFDLELAELTMTIPQAAPTAGIVNKY